MTKPGPKKLEGKIKQYISLPQKPDKLITEIKKKYTATEIKQIAQHLLTHELIKQPPKLVREYGRAMTEKAKLKAQGISGHNYSERQAWVMERDKYYKKEVKNE